MEHLIPKNINKTEFYNELNEACENNENYETLTEYKEHLSNEFNFFSKVDTVVKVFSGVLVYYIIMYGFSVLNMLSAVCLLAGAYVCNSILEDCLGEYELVVVAIRDMHYEVADGLLKAKSWE